MNNPFILLDGVHPKELPPMDNIAEVISLFLGQVLPVSFWVTSQGILGIAVATAMFLGRLWSPNYSLREIEDLTDLLLKRAGQVGIALLFSVSILLVFDGFSRDNTRPSPLITLLLASIFCIQLRYVRIAWRYHSRGEEP